MNLKEGISLYIFTNHSMHSLELFYVKMEYILIIRFIILFYLHNSFKYMKEKKLFSPENQLKFVI